MPNILRRLKVTEVSSVDRGAGQGVRVLLTKRDFSATERRTDAKRGSAMADGSFPVENSSDLENAIRLAGRAKDPTAARSHIRRRAAALGLTSKIPSSWTSKNMPFIARIKSALGFEAPTLAEVLSDAQADLLKRVNAILADGTMDTTAKAAAVNKAFADNTDALNGLVPDAIETALAAAGISLEKEDKMAGDDDKDKTDDKGDGGDPPKKPTAKAADLPEDVRKKLADFDVMQKTLGDLMAEREIASFRKMAADAGLPEAEAETIQKAMRGDKDGVGKLLTTIKALHAQVAETGLYREFGGKGASVAGSAYDTMMAKAAELRKAEPKLTIEQAFAKVYSDRSNRDLVALHKREELKVV